MLSCRTNHILSVFILNFLVGVMISSNQDLLEWLEQIFNNPIPLLQFFPSIHTPTVTIQDFLNPKYSMYDLSTDFSEV